jgi:hypothetical protein
MIFLRPFHHFVGAALVLLSGLAGAGRADLVIDSVVGANGNSQGKLINSGSSLSGAAVVFTTGSSSAWDLQTISMYFNAGTTTAPKTYSGGTINFNLYFVNGNFPTNPSDLLWIGSTSAAFGSFNGNTTASFSLTGLADLTASATYMLGMDVTGTVTDNSFLKLNSTTNVPSSANGWLIPSGYSYINATTFSSSARTVTAYDNSFPNPAGFGFDLVANAVAVPEPGTMLLGSIAAAGGAAAWWRRRRLAQAEAAQAQAECVHG